jgi:CheY-like chemotaxis protein/two-component sensor histidine kinase
LHDDISQQIALLSMDLTLLGRPGQGETRKLAAEALKHAQGIAESVHALSHRLHPAKLRLLGLVSALEALRIELSGRGMDIVFTHDDVPAALSTDLTLCLFRIVQEGLQNAIRHSSADQVSVHLNCSAGLIDLSIVDDGVGFEVDAALGRGLGLIGMGERVQAIGGSLTIRSTPGAGTTLKVTVPLDMVRKTETGDARVLLVDDNDAMLDRAGTALTPSCVIVGKARDGETALEAAEVLQPDVIVLDISMPGMTGFEVAAQLRESGSTAALVFLSVHEDETFVRAAKAAGAVGYVVKPRLASDLLPAVQQAHAGRQRIAVIG